MDHRQGCRIQVVKHVQLPDSAIPVAEHTKQLKKVNPLFDACGLISNFRLDLQKSSIEISFAQIAKIIHKTTTPYG
jgi:hypothetical protein